MPAFNLLAPERLVRYRFGLIVAAATLIADQVSKALVLFVLALPDVGSILLLPFLRFTMVWNTGISMGIRLGDLFGGADAGRIGLVLLTLAISVYLWRWLRRADRRMEALGLGLILGGAIGNAIDRVVHGAVADFIHVFGLGYHFYVFNVADAGITVGVILLIADSLMQARAPQSALQDTAGSLRKTTKVGDGCDTP